MKYFFSCLLVLLICAGPLSGQRRQRGAVRSQKVVGQYLCPMHKGIKAKSAGRCPKCGMNLVPVKTEKAAHANDEPTAAAKYFSDVELIDQDGRKVRFYSDILKGRTVVINALFTTCTNVCPPMSRNLERIQEALGDRLGKDVFLISITVDPVNDSPEKLKEYAQKFHARAGWSFLTGKKENIDWALYKLGQYVQDKTLHKTIVIIGNEATGLWKKAFGLASAEDLIKLVEEVMNDRPQKGTKDTKIGN